MNAQLLPYEPQSRIPRRVLLKRLFFGSLVIIIVLLGVGVIVHERAIKNLQNEALARGHGGYPGFQATDWGINFNLGGLQQYLKWLMSFQKGDFSIVSYTHGATGLVYEAYIGGTLCPVNNRVYLMPFNQFGAEIWHYIDESGAVMGYKHQSVLSGGGGGGGGVYVHPNRIFLMPQNSNSLFYFIQCDTATVDAYNHSNTQDMTFNGGVFVPTNQRIYLIPGELDAWAYIDTTTLQLITYSNFRPFFFSCHLGAYSASTNTIFIVSRYDSGGYIIDVSNDIVRGLTIPAGQYGLTSIFFTPLTNRLYLIPGDANKNTYYIDCATSQAVTYTWPPTHEPMSSYAGGAYSPTTGRIYFAPHYFGYWIRNQWTFLDTVTEQFTILDGPVLWSRAYSGAVYVPSTNRIYYVPFDQATNATWHYVQEYASGVNAAVTLMASPLFSSTITLLYL